MSLTQQESTFRFDFSHPRPPVGGEDDGLCKECAKLDLEESFTRAFVFYEGARRGRNTRIPGTFRADDGPAYLGHFYYVTSLGERLSRLTCCKLCKFLRQTCAEPNNGTYKLLAICSSESYLFEPLKRDTRGRLERRPWSELQHNVFMAVVPEVALIPKSGVPLRWFETDLPKNGSIYRLTPKSTDEYRIVLPRRLKAMADFDLVDYWLYLCRDAHSCCTPKKPTGASLPGFRAINCTKSPPVVEERPWSQKYVALSYVWGPPSGNWPQTILDAVEVTRRLGERYLWVDRLCIDQSNLEEKQFLLSKMDAIYEGAEFTIVAAAGDASTGLPGVKMTARKPQPMVELEKCTGTTVSDGPTSDPYFELVGITEEEFEETCTHSRWLDPHRHGLRSTMTIDLSEYTKDEEIMEEYDIPSDHLEFFQDSAEDSRMSIEEMMAKMKLLADRMGIPVRELVPYFKRQVARRAGAPEDVDVSSIPIMPPTSSSMVEKPLPPGKINGPTILVSTLEDPRVTISNSKWATRGWTYQEGVLSNRRLVFTEQQIYWECSGMALNETLDLPLPVLYDSSNTRMADYMLSGVFDGDLHRVPELQYGFKTSAVDEISKQVSELDGHVRAFTSRNLSYAEDSLIAFLGIAARYSTDNGLCLLLGIPVFQGQFANGNLGLQDTFALSLSTWTHTAQRVTEDAEMFVADCARRTQFPSWTWIGWEGRADFSATTAADSGEEEPACWDGDMYVDIFAVMNSETWVKSIDRLWSAEMLLHATDGREAILPTGGTRAMGTEDPSKTWLLTIRQPIVLRHMYLMHSTIVGEWRRLMGKRVQLYLSVPMTETELTDGHKRGDLITVLLFASTVPFIWNGTARYLILRRANDAGTRWERIGRLAMTLEERDMDKYQSTQELIAGLPVKKFGRDIVLI